MSFQIGEIVLYGTNGRQRVLKFQPGQINIISGASKTGKTALIDIVDYCLGSSGCNVAAGVIRQSVKWYALRLLGREKQLFIARSAPKAGFSTATAFFIELGSQVSIPETADFVANANLDGALSILNAFSGIRENEFVPPSPTRPPLTATLRHALLLCLQQQDEILHHQLLFHSQGEDFVPQAIKDTLPYFLGALDEDHLVKRGRLRDLIRLRNRTARQVAEEATLHGETRGRAATLYLEAVDVGLAPREHSPDSDSEARDLLKNLLERGLANELGSPDEDEYDRLLGEREALRRRLGEILTELHLVRRLNQQRNEFDVEGNEQRSRLMSLDLLGVGDGAACPVCAQPVPEALSELDDLRSSLAQLETELEGMQRSLPAVAAETIRLEEELANVRTLLAHNTDEMDALQRGRARLAQLRDEYARRSLVLGRISLYLEASEEVQENEDSQGELDSLDREIEALRTELDAEAVTDRMASILSRLAVSMTAWARELKLEHAPAPFRLDLSRLTVIADTKSGPVRMDQMGSGANWLGCHLISHFALHESFVFGSRPVPRFLFIDQPSSVYFPAEQDLDEGAVPDEDIESVRDTFEFIRSRTHALTPGFQVIVTDHAYLDDQWFRDAVVERWRGGKALIPADWL